MPYGSHYRGLEGELGCPVPEPTVVCAIFRFLAMTGVRDRQLECEMSLENENLILLAKAGNLIPGNPHVATLWRWASHRGYKGIRLETRKCAGKRFTSRESIARFLARIDAADPLSNVTPAESALAADGI